MLSLGGGALNLAEFGPPVMEQLLGFMYTGRVDVSTMNHELIGTLLSAASHYQAIIMQHWCPLESFALTLRGLYFGLRTVSLLPNPIQKEIIGALLSINPSALSIYFPPVAYSVFYFFTYHFSFSSLLFSSVSLLSSYSLSYFTTK
jgi:hypothetical protein